MTPSPYAPPKSGKSGPPTAGEVGAVVLFMQIVIFAVCLNFHAPIWVYLLITACEFVVRVPIVLLLNGVPRKGLDLDAFNAAEHPQGKEIWEYLRDATVALHAEGFFPLDPMLQSSGEGAKLCIATYQNDVGERVELVVMPWSPTRRGFREPFCFVQTSFVDGSRRETSNRALPDVLLLPPDLRIVTFPQVHDPVRLIRIHRALVASREPLAVAPFPEQSPREILSAAHARMVDHAIKSGTLIEGGAERLRYSVAGAIRSAWSLSPFVRDGRRLFDRWRAARILKELGLSGSDPAPIRLKDASSEFPTLKFVLMWAGMTALYGFVLLHPPPIGRVDDRGLLQRVSGGR